MLLLHRWYVPQIDSYFKLDTIGEPKLKLKEKKECPKNSSTMVNVEMCVMVHNQNHDGMFKRHFFGSCMHVSVKYDSS